jgi:hypothetical protein
MPDRDRELLALLKSAVRECTVGFHVEGRTLVGFALLTDDDVETLLASTLSAEELSQGDGDLVFDLGAWSETESAALERCGAEFRVLSRQRKSREDHVESSFALLVKALLESRQEGVFGRDVFLIVSSTDPGPGMDERANAAARALNDAETVSKRLDSIKKWENPAPRR